MYLFGTPGSKGRVGQQCKNSVAKKYGVEYCFQHAKQRGLLPADIIKKHTENHSKVQAARRDAERAAETEIQSNPIGSDEITDLILGATGKDSVDLGGFVEEFKAENAGRIEISDAWKKELFITWATADIHTREPKRLADVAKVLGVPQVTVHSWIKEPWFQEGIRSHGEDLLLVVYPEIIRTAAARALSGDRSAIAQIMKMVADNHTGGPAKKKEKPPLTDEQKEMAAIINGAPASARVVDEETAGRVKRDLDPSPDRDYLEEEVPCEVFQ